MSTQINLATFRLNTWSDFDKYLIGSDRSSFWKFVDKVYFELNKLPPKGSINITRDVHPNAIEKFIKICCMFICEGHPEYEFSNDYKTLKRNELEQTPRANSRNAQAKKNAGRNNTSAGRNRV